MTLLASIGRRGLSGAIRFDLFIIERQIRRDGIDYFGDASFLSQKTDSTIGSEQSLFALLADEK